MSENDLRSSNSNYYEENTDTDGNIIISKRKTLNVDIDIEYFIPKKTKNNNYDSNKATSTV